MWPKSIDALMVELRSVRIFETMSKAKISSDSGKAPAAARVCKWLVVERKLVTMRNEARYALEGMLLQRVGTQTVWLEFANCIRDP